MADSQLLSGDRGGAHAQAGKGEGGRESAGEWGQRRRARTCWKTARGAENQLGRGDRGGARAHPGKRRGWRRISWGAGTEEERTHTLKNSEGGGESAGEQ